MPTSPSRDDSANLQAKVTFALALIVVVSLLVFSYIISPMPDARIVSFSIIAVGLSAGMIAGTALSPSDNKESKRFTAFGQALAAFAGGYLTSKLDGLVSAAIAPDVIAQLTPVDIFRLFAFAATILVVGKATFSCRSYDRL